MSIPKMGILAMGLFAILLFVVSLGQTSTADQDVDISLKQATKTAMDAGINKGTLRVTEEVTINPTVTKNALYKVYADQDNFKDGQKKVIIHSIQSRPAMISTEVYNKFDVPIYKYATDWDKKKRDSSSMVREQETSLFEAKDLVKTIK
ncbi:DUF5411 family protein [Priestia koreensis]|uniref:DUF5411 family protein n=1 Tax=Priestia koreensis TaxID=284581 RepID=UPI003459A4E0